MERFLSGVFLISWEKEGSWTTEHQLISCPAQKWHMSLHFCHILLAEASPVVRPDVNGVEKYNFLQGEKENI